MSEDKIPADISAIPESANVQPAEKDYGVDKFFPSDDAQPAPQPAPTKKADAISSDDAPPPKKDAAPAPKPQTLAEKLAAKAKPAEKPAETPDPKAEKPAETAPTTFEEDQLDLDKKASVPARENFAKLKGITKTIRGQLVAKDREVAELRSKLEAGSKAPTAEQSAELERLRSEHKALNDRLLVIDTQNHPSFQAQYVAPKTAALTAAKELLGKDVDLAAMLTLPRSEFGKKVSELAKDLPAFDQTDFAQHMRNALQLEQGGRQALAKASETAQAIAAKNGAAQKQVFQQRWDAMRGPVGEHIVKLEVAPDAPADVRSSIEAYNQAVEQLSVNAEKVATAPMDEASIADHSIKAAAYDFHIGHVMPRLSQEIGQMQDTIRQLSKELEGYRSRNPKKDIGPSTGKSGADKVDPASMTIEQLADLHYNGGR